MKKWALVLILILGFLVANAPGTSSSDFELKPTSAARKEASGVVEVENPRPAPGRPARLAVTVQQLDPGTYVLMAETKGAAGSVFLGFIPVQDPTLGPEREEGSSRKEERHAQESTRLQTRVEANLPPQLEASDLERLVVSDRSGTVLLEGNSAQAK